jgi:hypothetical protein
MYNTNNTTADLSVYTKIHLTSPQFLTLMEAIGSHPILLERYNNVAAEFSYDKSLISIFNSCVIIARKTHPETGLLPTKLPPKKRKAKSTKKGPKIAKATVEIPTENDRPPEKVDLPTSEEETGKFCHPTKLMSDSTDSFKCTSKKSFLDNSKHLIRSKRSAHNLKILTELAKQREDDRLEQELISENWLANLFSPKYDPQFDQSKLLRVFDEKGAIVHPFDDLGIDCKSFKDFNLVKLACRQEGGFPPEQRNWKIAQPKSPQTEHLNKHNISVPIKEDVKE